MYVEYQLFIIFFFYFLFYFFFLCHYFNSQTENKNMLIIKCLYSFFFLKYVILPYFLPLSERKEFFLRNFILYYICKLFIPILSATFEYSSPIVFLHEQLYAQLSLYLLPQVILLDECHVATTFL